MNQQINIPNSKLNHLDQLPNELVQKKQSKCKLRRRWRMLLILCFVIIPIGTGYFLLIKKTPSTISLSLKNFRYITELDRSKKETPKPEAVEEKLTEISVSHGLIVGSHPKLSYNGEKIVYRRTKTGDDGLWVVNVDGSDFKKLTSDQPMGEGTFDFGWSYDDNLIFYHTGPWSGNMKEEIKLKIVNVNTDEIRTLFKAPQGFNIHAPRWLGEDQIAFILSGPNMSSPLVKVVDVKGEDIEPLANVEIYFWLIKGSNKEIPYQLSYIASVNTFGEVREITPVIPDAPGALSVPSVAPKTTEIAYINQQGIIVMDNDGGNAKLILSNEGGGAVPLFSPDGKRLVYSKSKDDGHRIIESDIYMINVDGSNEQRLTTSGEKLASEPSWSADGKKIVFFYRGTAGKQISILDITEDIEPKDIKIEIYFTNSKFKPIDLCNEVTSVTRETSTVATTVAAMATVAIEELLLGLTPQEISDDYSTQIPPGTTLISLSVDDNKTKINLKSPGWESLSACEITLAEEQVRQTLLQFPIAKTVAISVEGSDQWDIPPSIPPPTDLSAKSHAYHPESMVTLSWTADEKSDGNGAYTIIYSTSPIQASDYNVSDFPWNYNFPYPILQIINSFPGESIEVTFTHLEPDTTYYFVVKPPVTGYETELKFATVNHKTQSDSGKPKLVVLLIDNEIYSSLSSEITDYEKDIKREISDAVVQKIFVNSTDNPKDIVDRLENIYLNNNLQGVILIGWVPVPEELVDYSVVGIPIPEKSYPTIFPYTDFINNIYDYNDATGKFELVEKQSLYPSLPEIWHGIIRPPVRDNGIELLKNFFKRDHLFHSKELNFEHKILFATTFDISGQQVDENKRKIDDSQRWKSEEATIISNQIINGTEQWAAEYKNSIKKNSYELIYFNGDGNPYYHEFSINYQDIKENSPNNLYTYLLSCETANFLVENYIAGWYLFAGNTLAVTGYTMPFWIWGINPWGPRYYIYLHEFASGKTLGEVNRLGSRDTSQVLLGDPLIRIVPD